MGTPAQGNTSHIHPTRSLKRTSMHISVSVHVDYIKYRLAAFFPDFGMKTGGNEHYLGTLT